MAEEAFVDDRSEAQHTVACARDMHLFGSGPKRILALDGGGVRGALTIAFLERLEDLLADAAGRPVRLCDWFDLIGGTSTGAILAAGLALGYTARDMRAFYMSLGPQVFRRSVWRVPGWSAKFDGRRLTAELTRIIGDTRLGSDAIQTGLGVVLKRVDTGGSWVLINNPRSKFWMTPTNREFIGNSEMSLAKVVKASTAAPHFFEPELIDIIEGQAPGLFIDGALTPHNNPSLALYMATILPPVGLNWRSGPDQISIVSIGTGSFRPKLSAAEARKLRAIGLAVNALSSQIAENQRLILMLMSWLGQTSTSWPIDAEIGDAGLIEPPFGRQCRFDRFDVTLEKAWLAEHLGVELSEREVVQLRTMDNHGNMSRLYELGQVAASKQMRDNQIAL